MLKKSSEAQIPDDLLVSLFARVDQIALGLAVGVVLGAGLSLATVILLVKGGDQVGPTMRLLNHYLPGYSVTWPGAAAGAANGLVLGFAIGWAVGFIRNVVMRAYLYLSAFWARLDRFLDDM